MQEENEILGRVCAPGDEVQPGSVEDPGGACGKRIQAGEPVMEEGRTSDTPCHPCRAHFWPSDAANVVWETPGGSGSAAGCLCLFLKNFLGLHWEKWFRLEQNQSTCVE